MTLQTVLVCTALGFASNLIAELFLTFDLKQPFHQLDSSRRVIRLTRWSISILGLFVIALVDPSLPRLIVMALFSISAATDFETRYLPPDWFVYGAVIAGIVCGFAAHGVPGLRDVIVAQAICFVLMTLGVLLAGIADSGDIKLLMQYGAACGSLSAVGVGIAAETVVRLAVLLLVIAGSLLARASLRQSLRRAAMLRLPHGPIAWIGVLAALTIRLPSP